MHSITLEIEHPQTQAAIEVEIEFTVSPAEFDVGIMSWGIEDEHITAPNEVLNGLLTEVAWEKIRQKINDSFDPYDHDYCEDER